MGAVLRRQDDAMNTPSAFRLRFLMTGLESNTR